MAYQEELVMLLISRYFANLTSVLIVSNSSSSSETSEHYLKATQATFQNLTQQGHPVGLYWINVAGLTHQSDFNKFFLQLVDMGIQGYITILASVVEFLSARVYATEHSVIRLKDKYYLFLTENVSPINVLGQETLKLYPHHLLVSGTTNNTALELWTQKFIGAEDNTNAVHLDTFFPNGSFAKNVELYPNKLLDMQGRTLDVASVTYIPYIVSSFVAVDSGDVDSIDPKQPRKSITYSGTEAEIVLSYCRLRNCIVKVMPYGNDNWGGVYENGSSGGMIGSVYRKETEFGIGCYYNWYNDIFETSIAIAKSAATILAPAPSRYPEYMTIVLPFNKLIWILVILSIIVSSFVMHGIRYFTFRMGHGNNRPCFGQVSSYRLTLLQIVAIFFQQSFSQSRLDRLAARFFLSALLLAGITLENTYSGQLKSLLTIPIFTDPVDTVQKFSLTNWKWASPSSAWILSIASSDISYEQIMTKKFEELSYEELKNASYSGVYGIGLERLHSGRYSFGDYIKDGALSQLILTKDDLYYDWTRAFAIRGWPQMDNFNTYILWCLEHGLYHYWESKHVLNLLDRKTQEVISALASGQLQKFPPRTLSIGNISGPLMSLVIGYSLALVMFVFEIFADKIFKQ